jgi:hypothetical protein
MAIKGPVTTLSTKAPAGESTAKMMTTAPQPCENHPGDKRTAAGGVLRQGLKRFQSGHLGQAFRLQHNNHNPASTRNGPET